MRAAAASHTCTGKHGLAAADTPLEAAGSTLTDHTADALHDVVMRCISQCHGPKLPMHHVSCPTAQIAHPACQGHNMLFWFEHVCFLLQCAEAHAVSLNACNLS